MYQIADHMSILTGLCALNGLHVLDVGAGSGTFARQLADAGAIVKGIEIEADKVEAARQKSEGRFEVLEGRAESLPVPSGSQDLVCFMFSMHHVPLGLQPKALEEARRVLKDGGRLHVVDPRPFGPMADVVAFVEDETEVRTETQSWLDAIGAEDSFARLAQRDYVLEQRFRDFPALVATVVAVDPARAERLSSVEAEMRAAFDTHGTKGSDGTVNLTQPCVAYHFETV